MITIPASVVWFTLGFIVGISLLIIIAFLFSKKDK